MSHAQPPSCHSCSLLTDNQKKEGCACATGNTAMTWIQSLIYQTYWLPYINPDYNSPLIYWCGYCNLMVQCTDIFCVAVGIMKRGLRAIWDTFMFHAVIKKRGRVPSRDGFVARRIAGPGLASNYFYQVIWNFNITSSWEPCMTIHSPCKWEQAIQQYLINATSLQAVFRDPPPQKKKKQLLFKFKRQHSMYNYKLFQWFNILPTIVILWIWCFWTDKTRTSFSRIRSTNGAPWAQCLGWANKKKDRSSTEPLWVSCISLLLCLFYLHNVCISGWKCIAKLKAFRVHCLLQMQIIV